MKSEAKTIVQNFRVTPSFQSRLVSIAAKQRKPVSVFIREAVEAAVTSLVTDSWLISRTK